MQSLILTSPDGRSIALQVEIADDAGEWEQGLMNRTTLADGMGMLFVFTDERPLQFWMKNTLIPLDVVFFDASGRFISMQTMEPCVDDPCATYPSDRPAKYALEVPAGFTVANGVGDGWVMMIGQ